MEEWLHQFGYVGLFVISFLSATILPLFSEAFVLWMPAQGYSTWGVLLIATAGNVLGSVTNYWIGKGTSGFVFNKWIRVESKKLERAKSLYTRWGAPVLLLAWVPVIGDPLTIVAGLFQLRFTVFVVYVLTGKLLRYAALLGLLQFLI
ncbi:MAG TPA: YqaA family protein [Anaerolineales bacterium]|nr:YqaA family protein [Anaerolineales bacterium]